MLEAIILAGGFGTRLKEVLPGLPKSMAPIHGKPFLAYLLDNLEKKGFKKVILSVGYMADKIIDHFGARYQELVLEYSIEKEALGTGGAARLALEKCSQDHVYIMNGDTYVDFNIKDTESIWKSNSCAIIITAHVDNAARYGLVECKNNIVQGFLEKGYDGPGLVSAGCYLFSKYQLDKFKLNSFFSLELDYLKNAVKKEKFYMAKSNGIFIDIGVPDEYKRANIFFFDRN
jgi:D-glycero-alpha-D-manno-heptose 1-phosphate guanylyltransferase